MSKKKERVLLIGLDGAVFSIIEPLVKKGKMQKKLGEF